MAIENRWAWLDKIAYILLVVLTCECVVGSSGRWLDIGSISVRMLIFGIALIATLPFVIKRFRELIKNGLIISILVFGLFLCFSLIIGFSRGNDSGYVVADLTSMLFLLIVPGYIAVCNTQKKINGILKAASYASIVLACITILLHFIFLFINSGQLNSLNKYLVDHNMGGFFNFGDNIQRIYFRSSICFILPFLYNLYLIIKHKKEDSSKRFIWPYVFMAISFTAIVLTYTRSIWFGALFGALLFIIINIKNYKKMLKGIGVALAGFLVFVLISFASYGFEGVLSNSIGRVLLGQNFALFTSASTTTEDSSDIEEIEDTSDEELSYVDQQRNIQLQSEARRNERLRAVMTGIKENWLLGGGLGQDLGLEIYEGKVEFTYLDIFGKMGIAGFASFLTVLLLPFVLAYKRFRQKKYSVYMGILMGVMLCIYGASFFNPFITSPIGFSMYALLAASIYAKEEEKPMESLIQ